jgi:biopolymer transport protein ExbD
MKISGKKDFLLSLESVAMTDIVLNMFIFFFISFSLVYTFDPSRSQKLEIKLPKATNTTATGQIVQLSITLTNEGLVYLDKDLVTNKELKEKIGLKQKANANLSVLLRSDRLVRFKELVSILDALSGLGITRINIAAVKE